MLINPIDMKLSRHHAENALEACCMIMRLIDDRKIRAFGMDAEGIEILRRQMESAADAIDDAIAAHDRGAAQ
jgi:hypothetical protein